MTKSNSETESLGESDSSVSVPMSASTTAGDRAFRWSRFVRNLYEMTINSENAAAVGFSADGYCLEVRDCKFLSAVVLKKYFKHNNVSSFIRQLNNYGFKTVPVVMNSKIAHCFAHEFFQRDRLDLLECVKRRASASDSQKAGEGLSVYREKETQFEEKIGNLKRVNDQLRRQNGELLEENKRLKANWMTVQESLKARVMDHHQHQHQHQQRRSFFLGASEPMMSSDPSDLFLMPGIPTLFPEDF